MPLWVIGCRGELGPLSVRTGVNRAAILEMVGRVGLPRGAKRLHADFYTAPYYASSGSSARNI